MGPEIEEALPAGLLVAEGLRAILGEGLGEEMVLEEVILEEVEGVILEEVGKVILEKVGKVILEDVAEVILEDVAEVIP